MATCKYCGKSAGVFRKTHKECEEIHQDGVLRVQNSVLDAIVVENPAAHIQTVIDEVAPSSFLENTDIGGALVEGWNQAVEVTLEQGPVDSETEGKFADIQKAFEYSQEDLDERGNFTKLVESTIIREIIEGNIEEITGRVRFAGEIPFNFQKSEQLVWLFNDVAYYEIRSQTRYRGSSQRIGIRVAKGMYYSVGVFAGQPVQTNSLLHVDTGMLGITTKHIYFAGATQSFRVKYDKIVSFQPYSNGLGIQRDAARAKPQIFQAVDGWFIYNLVTNLAQA